MIDLEADVRDVAQALLGSHLRNDSPDGLVSLFITEVEAYDGDQDPASHAFRGPTARNAAMYGPAGHLYVYRSHGLHWCANIVTGPRGQASAVLLRAGRVVEGEALATQRRGPRVSVRDLARGPGRLCQALGIDADHYGADVFGSGPVTLDVGERLPNSAIAAGPRVGVSRAHEVPWRFWIAGDPSVSPYRRSARL